MLQHSLILTMHIINETKDHFMKYQIFLCRITRSQAMGILEMKKNVILMSDFGEGMVYSVKKGKNYIVMLVFL